VKDTVEDTVEEVKDKVKQAAKKVTDSDTYLGQMMRGKIEIMKWAERIQ
jgi:hypothetical protein